MRYHKKCQEKNSIFSYLQFCNPISWTLHILNYKFCLIKKSKFELSKVAKIQWKENLSMRQRLKFFPNIRSVEKFLSRIFLICCLSWSLNITLQISKTIMVLKTMLTDIIKGYNQLGKMIYSPAHQDSLPSSLNMSFNKYKQ